MINKTSIIKKEQLKNDLPDIKSGDLIRVHQKIKEKNKERIQIFEGRVIARKHGKGINSTITVRRVMNNVGVEKIFPIHSPTIEKFEVVSRGKVRRAKLYYLRAVSPKKARLKKIEFKEAIGTEPEPEITEEATTTEENKEQISQEEIKQEAEQETREPQEKETETKESAPSKENSVSEKKEVSQEQEQITDNEKTQKK